MPTIEKKKKRYKLKKSRHFLIINVSLILIILMLSLGWTAFSQKLTIDDVAAMIRPKKDIRITGITIEESSSSVSSTYEEYNVKSISAGVILPEADSYIIYKIQITNLGNTEMGILTITGLPDNLEYSLEGYNLKEKICVDGECKLGIQKEIYLKIKYKDGHFNAEKNTYPLNLTFDFRSFHKVTYVGFDIDTKSYPQEVMDGDNLIVQFPNSIQENDFKIFVSDLQVDFQYNNYRLQLSNVSGDVVIQYRTLADRVMQLANSKKCNLNGTDNPTSFTDIKCPESSPPVVEPHYYTYFAGTNECLDFNYVWYSGYMWRITEILNDGSIKMIAENILSAINYGQEPYFWNSYIKQWLNEDFLDTLYNYDAILVTNATWDISPWYDWCWREVPYTDQATVGLLNPYEFSKAKSGYGEKHFLNLGHSWWLSSYNYSGNDNPTAVASVQSNGLYSANKVPSVAFGVRPMVVLKADVKFSGEGTPENPFVLLDDIPNAKSGEKISTRTPGELVKINDMLYRIVNIHENEDGKLVTKLKSATYVTDENGEVMQKQFGSMNKEMYGYEKIVESGNEDYWGAYLNGPWLQQQDIKKYLVEDTYYLDPAQDSKDAGSDIGSYKNTTCKEKNTKETIKKCEKTDKIWKGYVGLPIVGELFAYPLGGNDVHDYKTATMTPYGDADFPMIGAFDSESQGIFQHAYNEPFAVKPTITLNENVIIKSGDGKTPGTAFEIGFEEELK